MNTANNKSPFFYDFYSQSSFSEKERDRKGLLRCFFSDYANYSKEISLSCDIFKDKIKKKGFGYFVELVKNPRQALSWTCKHVSILASFIFTPGSEWRWNSLNSRVIALQSDRLYKKYMQFVPKEDEHAFSRFTLFAITGGRGNLYYSYETSILDYLEGNIDLSQMDIHITKQNIRSVLNAIKLFDIAIAWLSETCEKPVPLSKTTYELRTTLLKICPRLTTKDVYTKSLCPKKLNDWLYLENPHNWIPDRNKHHIHMVACHYIHGRHLSSHMAKNLPQVLALRGNTCSGKTTLLSKVMPELQHEAMVIKGILNPDIFKAHIKRANLSIGCKVTNSQVYHEATAIFENYMCAFREIHQNIIIDKRLPSLSTLEEVVIAPAKRFNRKIILLDIDVPIVASLLRNLTRDPYGEDPCVPFDDIVGCFEKIRSERTKIIGRVNSDEAFNLYKLYKSSKSGALYCVAAKTNGFFAIYDKKGFAEATQMPTNAYLKALSKRTITKKMIKKAVGTIVAADKKHLLEKWIGKTLRHATLSHLQGLRQ